MCLASSYSHIVLVIFLVELEYADLEFLGHIGSGASGQVWKGLWKSNGCKTIAIKKLMDPDLPEREVGTGAFHLFNLVSVVALYYLPLPPHPPPTTLPPASLFFQFLPSLSLHLKLIAVFNPFNMVMLYVAQEKLPITRDVHRTHIYPARNVYRIQCSYNRRDISAEQVLSRILCSCMAISKVWE